MGLGSGRTLRAPIGRRPGLGRGGWIEQVEPDKNRHGTGGPDGEDHRGVQGRVMGPGGIREFHSQAPSDGPPLENWPGLGFQPGRRPGIIQVLPVDLASEQFEQFRPSVAGPSGGGINRCAVLHAQEFGQRVRRDVFLTFDDLGARCGMEGEAHGEVQQAAARLAKNRGGAGGGHGESVRAGSRNGSVHGAGGAGAIRYRNRLRTWESSRLSSCPSGIMDSDEAFLGGDVAGLDRDGIPDRLKRHGAGGPGSDDAGKYTAVLQVECGLPVFRGDDGGREQQVFEQIIEVCPGRSR